ncbi:MAG: transposase, partial [Polyangiaceae bacterium]|nr:transposase [Polyangiaceae bacterium]
MYIERLERPKKKHRPRPLYVRAAQVMALLLSRGNEPFRWYFLSASVFTIERWRRFLIRGSKPGAVGGRPKLTAEVAELIVTLKQENGSWGAKRIQQELRRMGVKVSQPTIQKVLREHGFKPHPGRKVDFDRVMTSVKDALWALDYFAVRMLSGELVQVLLVIDIATRELIELKVCPYWEVESAWTVRTFAEAIHREGRRPEAVVHDHGTHFMRHFPRAMRVLEIREELTPTGLPSMNCYAERAIGSVRRELLRYIRPRDADHLQEVLDDYRSYANRERAHQGIEGSSPEERAAERPLPPVLTIDELRQRRLMRRDYAGGLLHEYELALDEPTQR